VVQGQTPIDQLSRTPRGAGGAEWSNLAAGFAGFRIGVRIDDADVRAGVKALRRDRTPSRERAATVAVGPGALPQRVGLIPCRL
jgi:hypothetical protein